jgi:hypothetical protein
MFLAHSVVLCPAVWAKFGDGRAFSKGDVIPGPFLSVAVVIGFTSDAGGVKDGGEGVAGLLSSLLCDQQGVSQGMLPSAVVWHKVLLTVVSMQYLLP